MRDIAARGHRLLWGRAVSNWTSRYRDGVLGLTRKGRVFSGPEVSHFFLWDPFGRLRSKPGRAVGFNCRVLKHLHGSRNRTGEDEPSRGSTLGAAG